MLKNILRKISNKNGLLTFPHKIHRDTHTVCWSWYFACEPELRIKMLFFSTLYHTNILSLMNKYCGL